MTRKVYFDLNNHPAFTELQRYCPDPNAIKFEDYAKTVSPDPSTSFVFFGADTFDSNLNHLETLFEILKKQHKSFTLITELSSPLTHGKINLCKMCTIDKMKRAIFCHFDYPTLVHHNLFNNWVDRLTQLIQRNITPVPVIILTKQMVRCTTPCNVIKFFQSLSISVIDFMFVHPNDTENTPYNDELIDWLTSLYQYNKEVNKGKMTCQKFVIRGFKELKNAKNGQYKELFTERVMTSAFGGLVQIPMRECKRCPNCPFKDFYRNREYVPEFEGVRCLRNIFDNNSK